MRRVAIFTVALVLAPAAHAATIEARPQAFSPALGPLTVTAQLEREASAGVRLATGAGRPLGWLDPPQARGQIIVYWNGELDGGPVREGFYEAQLVVRGRVLGAAPFRVDRTAPQLDGLSVSNGSTPFAGDGPLLTTISPNGDGFRDQAGISFTLREPAVVTLNVQRTVRVPRTIFTQTRRLPEGPHTLAWAPAAGLAPRTYLLALTAQDTAGNTRAYGAETAFVGRYLRAPVVRVQGVDAGFTRPSYAPGQLALLRVATDAPKLELQVFQAGPEHVPTYADNALNGVAVSPPSTVGWERRRDAPEAMRFRVGNWPSGFYFVRLTAPDGRVGYAPFVVRPAAFGALSRIAVVLPTNTWQAYNFYDRDGDGYGETWYAGPPHQRVALDRPYLRRGVPPFFRRYDLGFLHWLYWTGKSVDFLSESDLAFAPNGEALAGAYDLVVFPGHNEYVTDHEYDLIEQFRDAGGNLIFLSANNFFWRVEQKSWVLKRTALWRDLGRPEARLIGVQYLANDEGAKQGVFLVRNTAATPWLWEGTGLAEGSSLGDFVGGYGIEIDATTVDSPPGTTVLAEIPNVFGEGLTAQMTYYETPAEAKVFAAGALDFGGSASTWPVRRLLENLWVRLSVP